MTITLSPVESRVLGCLAEKELTTPEYYPLSLNALTNACNQKSNRAPVMTLEEPQVLESLDTLRKKQLALLSAEGVRTKRFAHNLRGVLHLETDELAILTELLLRGPQTVGELRTRAERMHPFTDLAAVNEVLQELAERSPALVTQLARQPGRKEPRYAQLLCNDELPLVDATEDLPAEPQNDNLAQQVEELQTELQQLRCEFETFKKQFE
ncbi:MAG: DUF480 domain-containing protein [Desulfuromonas sp.]|nr:MAG: DUF480 domain-containing protein [Desulfuromonas sp.]